MALTVGTDSYVSLEDALAYHNARNNSAWSTASSEALREAALRKATQYLDDNYSWLGTIADTSQELGWPRTGVYDKENRLLSDIPKKIERATCELALIALDGPLEPVEEKGGRVKREKVEGLETEYFEDAPIQAVYVAVDMMMKDIGFKVKHSPKGSMVRIIRS